MLFKLLFIEGFFCLDYRTVDDRCNIITDAPVIAGSVHGSISYLDRLDRQETLWP